MAKKETKKAAKKVDYLADCSCKMGYQCPTCVEYYASLEKK